MVVHVKLKSKLWIHMYSSRANCGYICIAQDLIVVVYVKLKSKLWLCT